MSAVHELAAWRDAMGGWPAWASRAEIAAAEEIRRINRERAMAAAAERMHRESAAEQAARIAELVVWCEHEQERIDAAKRSARTSRG